MKVSVGADHFIFTSITTIIQTYFKKVLFSIPQDALFDESKDPNKSITPSEGLDDCFQEARPFDIPFFLLSHIPRVYVAIYHVGLLQLFLPLS